MGPELWRARRRLLVRAVILAWTVVFGATHVLEVAVPDRPGTVSLDTRMQLRWLSRSITDFDAELAQKYFPEGELFTYEFYGLALENVAETTRDPDDIALAAREVRAMLPKIDGLLTHAPFDRMARWPVRGGICWFAGQNLLRARLLALVGDADLAEVKRFHDDSAVLARAFAGSTSGVLEAYPGMSWPVDSLFGYRSLQIHDRLYDTKLFTTFGRFKQTMRRFQDRSTGLMPSFVYLDGRPRDVPRGCALSWSLAVLPDLDPEYAAEQWAAYRRGFARCAGGLCLFREYPAGLARGPDSDSGPIVGGLGMSASAFGLAAARATGDMDSAESLRRTGELLGIPALSWWGKRYLGGRIALFDVLSVWTRTVPTPATTAGAFAWAPVIGLSAVWAALATLALRAFRRARAELRRAEAQSGWERGLFLATALTIGLHLIWPAFVGVLLMMVLSLLGALSRRAPVKAPSRAMIRYRVVEEMPR
ncbi:MAG: hypothetical protein ABJE95_22160 [Byssovorax sp.]